MGDVSRRFWVVLAVLAVVPIVAFWGLRIVDVARGDFFEGPTTFAVASDFAVIYTAADMAATGDAGDLYEFDTFQARYLATIGDDPAENTLFAHPPVVAVVFVPFTALGWKAAYLVWISMSVALLVLSSFLLVSSQTLGFVTSVLVTLPAYLALMMGQLTMLWFLAFVAAALVLRSGRPELAAVPIAVLALKPTLLIGVGLWWLIDRRRHGNLALLAGLLTAIVLISLPVVGTVWLEYPQALIDFSSIHAASDAQWGQFSPWGFIGLLGVDSLPLQRAAGVVLSVAGVAVWAAFWRRWRQNSDLVMAAAIVLSLWAAPHVIAYDWVLLSVAGVLVAGALPNMTSLVARAGVALAFSSLWSIVLGNWTRDQFGWTVQWAVLVLGVVALAISRAAIRSTGAPEAGGQGPTPSRT